MRRGLSPSLMVLVVTWVLGCGGDQRSGAAPAGDTSGMNAGDTAQPVTADTGARGRDTSATTAPARDTTAGRARAESTAARKDTAARVATKPAPKPAPRKSRPAKPAAPAPNPDTAAVTASAQTGSTTSQPADTTSAGSQTAADNAPLRDQYHTAPLDTVPQQVYDGWKQFNLNCARCHGEDVQGTTIAPHLIVSLKPDGPINTKELFIQTVCAGRPAKGMPAWCALGMEMPTIEAIYSYVKGRSDAKIHPGRPAVRAGG